VATPIDPSRFPYDHNVSGYFQGNRIFYEFNQYIKEEIWRRVCKLHRDKILGISGNILSVLLSSRLKGVVTVS
jgi:hypothetical protein